MDMTAVLFLVGFLLVFGLMLSMFLRSNRREKETKQQAAQSLGFFPLNADKNLTQKISTLYQRTWSNKSYGLRNVFRRVIPEGEMLLFDLVGTTSEDDSSIERQAVALISPSLNLPPFSLTPKVNQKYALSGLSNRIMEWGVSKIGEPVAFPQFPELTERYVITSPDPDRLRRFMDEPLARFLSQTEMFTLHAAGDMFTFAEIDPSFKTTDLQSLSRRVNRALEIFRALRR